MKKLLLLFFFFLTYATAANSQQLLWHKTIGNADTVAMEYVTLPDGGYAAVFRENTFNTSISRYDSLGNEIWNTPFDPGLRLAEHMFAMLKVVPGGFIAGLQQYSSDTTRLALVKVNWQGTVLWTKTIPTGRDHNAFCDMHIRSANEYVLLAAASNFSQTFGDGGGYKYTAIGVDSTGNKRWHKIYMDPLGTIDIPKSIVPYTPNGFIFTGFTGQPDAPVKLIKTNVIGEVLQNELLSDSAAPDGYATSTGNFIPTSDGNIVFTGCNAAGNWPDRFVLVTKVDTSLNKLWTITHTELGGHLEYSNVHELANGNILLVTQQVNANKIILLTISPQGQKLDTAYVTVPSTPFFGALMSSFLLSDGSLFYGGWDFMAKIGNVGFPTTFTSSPEQIHLSSHLGLAYPNPAESTVTVPYTLPQGTSSATLRIAEVATGRLVREVPLSLNAEQVQLDLNQLQSGLYTYTLMLNGVPNATKKLVVIK